MTYNWQRKDWPNFQYHTLDIEETLFRFFEKAGFITGIVRGLPEDTRLEAVIEVMVAEAIKTSEIEGEFLNRRDVMSSIKKALGLITKVEQLDKRAEGIGKLMIDVRESYASPLTKEQLFSWHQLLLEGSQGIKVGAWRDHAEPMQVVSGPMGRQIVHYEAPPSIDIPLEMERFLDWFNATAPGQPNAIKQAPVRCAIAHLYFETIHPFEDGNGRIGRAIAEKALSQGLGRPVLLSLSRTIERNKNDYYDSLQAAQRSLEITPWVNYFVGVIMDAQEFAEKQIDFTLKKTIFFDKFRDQLAERQLKAILRVMEAGPEGFKGGLNAAKYGSMNRISKATATRDLQELLAKGILVQSGTAGGRSTSYELNLNDIPIKKNAEDSLASKMRAAIKALDEPDETIEKDEENELKLRIEPETRSSRPER